MMNLPLKIYPGRIRSIIGFLTGIVLFGVVLAAGSGPAGQIGYHFYMYGVFYGLPVLAIVSGFKGAFFPTPQAVLYSDGFAYPKIGLKKLPWRDIQGTFLHENVNTGRCCYFFPTESDRRLDLLLRPDSPALQQIYPVYRFLLVQRKGCIVLPIGLMGSEISTQKLQQMVDLLVEQKVDP